MKFSELEKNCIKSILDFRDQYSIAVLGNCATQHLSMAIKGFAYEERIALNVYDADYDQIDTQIRDEESELYDFVPNFTLFYLCTEKIYEEFCNLPSDMRKDLATHVIQRIEEYWSCVNRHYATYILQFNFVQIDDRVFGNFGNKMEDSFIYQIRKLNYLLMEKCRQYNNVFLIDIDYFMQTFGQDFIRDEKMYYIAKMPLSTKILPMVAEQVVKVIRSIKGKIKK